MTEAHSPRTGGTACNALVLAVLVAGAVAARGDEYEGILGLLEEERVVSATRVEQDLSDAPSSITVISREQIELSGARSLTDLVRLVPGLDVIDFNPSYVALSIRGFNDESNTAILVLIDGVKVNLELTGGAILAALALPVEEVERIEVIRGPGSAMWGQNAYHGVINIITRDPRDGTEGLAMARAGEIGGRTATVRYQRDGAWAWKVFGSYDATDGRVHPDEEDRASSRGGFSVVSDGPHEVRVDLLYDGTDGTIFSSLGEVTADSIQTILRGSYRHGGLWAQAYWTRTDLGLGLRFPGIIPDLFPGLGSFDGVGDTYDGEVLYSWELERHHVTAGGGARLNRFRTDVQVGGGADETLSHVLIQDIWKMSDDVTLTAGARYDENSITEGAFSPRLSVTWSPGQHTLRASAGQAFRNPSFIENQIDLEDLRAVFPDGTIANPDLRNEAITSFEMAYGYTKERRFRVQTAVFYDLIRDFVSFDVQDPASPTFARYRQLEDGFEAWGGELEAAWAASDNVELFGHVAHVSLAENPDDPLVDDENPEWRGLLGVRVRRKPFRGQVTAQYVGERTMDVQDPSVGILGGLSGRDVFVPVEMDAYVLVNLHAAVSLWDDRLDLFVTGFNVLDADVQEFPSMPWDRDDDPSTRPENFGGEPSPRQVLAGLTLHF